MKYCQDHKNFFSALLTVMLLMIASGSYCQSMSGADRKAFEKKQDSLKVLAKRMITDSLPEGRMRADSVFVRTLIRSLQLKNSFNYPFDSVQGISKLYAPDSSFRLFSWNLTYDEYYSRQRGAIQM